MNSPLTKSLLVLATALCFWSPVVQAQVFKGIWRDSLVRSHVWRDTVLSFAGQELALSVAQYKQYPTTKTIFGREVGGDFTWGALGLTLAQYQRASGQASLGGYALLPVIKEAMLTDTAKAHTFGQLYPLKMLKIYGANLKQNALWNSLSPQEKAAVIRMVDFRRSYDVSTKMPTLGRPANYLAVGLLVGTMAYDLGLEKDKATLQALLNQCVAMLQKHDGWMDDDVKGRGRFDRYSFEFIRFCYQAAHILKDAKAKKLLTPMVAQANQFQQDAFHPVLKSSTYFGRSLQNVWEDTYEWTGFLLSYPELIEPMSAKLWLSLTAQSYNRWVRLEYNHDTHLSRFHEPGRTTYSYITPLRLWGSTILSFGKLLEQIPAITAYAQTIDQGTFKLSAPLPAVAKWYGVKASPRGPQGIYLFRKGKVAFQLPVVAPTGSTAGQTDYQVFPHGLMGTTMPVAQQIPMLAGKWTISDGRELTLPFEADSVKELPEGIELIYRHFITWQGAATDVPMRVSIKVEWQDSVLVYEQRFRALTEPLILASWQGGIVSSYALADMAGGRVIDERTGLSLGTIAQADWPTTMTIRNPGTGPMGKGAFYPVQLFLDWHGSDIVLRPREDYAVTWLLQPGNVSNE